MLESDCSLEGFEGLLAVGAAKDGKVVSPWGGTA